MQAGRLHWVSVRSDSVSGPGARNLAAEFALVSKGAQALDGTSRSSRRRRSVSGSLHTPVWTPEGCTDVLEGAVELEDAMLDDLAQKAEEERTTFVGRFDAESEVRPDHIVDMAVDTAKLQFFDLETGTSIRAGA